MLPTQETQAACWLPLLAQDAETGPSESVRTSPGPPLPEVQAPQTTAGSKGQVLPSRVSGLLKNGGDLKPRRWLAGVGFKTPSTWFDCYYYIKLHPANPIH